MSIDSAPMPPLDVRAYDATRAEWIALRYASGEPGTSLRALHLADPAAVPEPLIIARWRKTWPAFAAVMVEADEARAAAMMDETVEIADDSSKLAANAKNGIAARWRMAEALAPGMFGQRRILAGDANAPLRIGQASELSDADLMAIARGADPTLLLAGGAGTSPAPPTSPPVQSGGGLTGGSEVSLPAPTIPGGEYPVSIPIALDDAYDVDAPYDSGLF